MYYRHRERMTAALSVSVVVSAPTNLVVRFEQMLMEDGFRECYVPHRHSSASIRRASIHTRPYPSLDAFVFVLMVSSHYVCTDAVKNSSDNSDAAGTASGIGPKRAPANVVVDGCAVARVFVSIRGQISPQVVLTCNHSTRAVFFAEADDAQVTVCYKVSLYVFFHTLSFRFLTLHSRIILNIPRNMCYTVTYRKAFSCGHREVERCKVYVCRRSIKLIARH
jgi:hypothetical protein